MLLRSSVAVAAATFVTASFAREYTIEPNSVPIAQRENWCETEMSTCPIICQQMGPGTTLVNTCDPDTLTYGCLCGDNIRPNVSEYSLTLPYFVCQEWGNQCVEDCPSGDNACASDCREQNPCGAQDPVRVTSTASSATMEPTASATDEESNTIYTGSPGSSEGDDDNAGVSLLAVGRSYGLVMTLGGMFLGFAVL